MFLGTALLAFFGACLASALTGFLAYRWLCAERMLDVPNERSSHVQPTIRGGGIAIVATIAVALAAIGIWRFDKVALGLVGLVAVLGAVSFLDDMRSVPAGTRLGLHFLAAIGGAWLLGWPLLAVEVESGAGVTLPPVLSGLLIVLWLAGFPNAFNFMDGINGHAGLQTVMTAGGGAWIGAMAAHDWTAPPVLVSAVVAGAASGFLPYNFPKARMFMGDVGSVPLGYMLAFVALWQAKLYGWHLLLPLVLLQFNFIFDAGVTLGRRMLKGERWLEPHREHFYERMALASGSHTVVTNGEMAVQLVCVSMLVASTAAEPPWAWALPVAVIGVWLAYFVSCEVYCRRRGFGFRAVQSLGPASSS